LAPGPEVQVRVFSGASCDLLVPGRAVLLELGGEQLLFEGTFPEDRVRLQAREGRLVLGDWEHTGPAELFISGKNETGTPALGLDAGDGGRFFLGSFALSAHDGEVRVVNLLSLEQYLVGVVGAEMPLSYPLEALKAQVIAARTFAFYELLWDRDHGDTRPFEADTSFQMYGGLPRRSEKALRAVTETAGEVLLFRGSIFRSYYHSTCGGTTVPGKKVFGDAAIQPLDGVACSACLDSDLASWTVTVTAADLARALAASTRMGGVDLTGLRTIRVSADAIGRAARVQVELSTGSLGFETSEFRRLLSAVGKSLPSSTFGVSQTAGEYHFRGQGFGHRVGLCQVGAGRKAREQDCRAILAHYYPGSAVAPIGSFQ